MFKLPVVFLASTWAPVAVLKSPCVLEASAISPSAVLWLPLVVLKCAKTIGRVMHAGGEILERKSSLSCIAIWIASVRCRANRLHCGQNPKTSEREHNEKQTAPQRRAGHRICH